MRDKPDMEDANLALKLYDLRRETEMRKARNLIGRVVAGGAWEDIAALLDHEHPENAHLRQVTGYWEMVASFVLRGIFHPAVYLDTCSEGLFTLVCFKPHLERIREVWPHFLVRTEEIVRDIPALKERVDLLEARMAKWREEMASRKPRRRAAAKPGKKKTKRRAKR